MVIPFPRHGVGEGTVYPFFNLSGVLHSEAFEIDRSVIFTAMNSTGYKFSCSGLPYSPDLLITQRSSVEWRMTACHLPGLEVYLTIYLDMAPEWNSNELAFMLLNITQFSPAEDEAGIVLKQPFTQVDTDGEWQKFSTPSNGAISLRMCVASFYANVGNITMTRGTDTSSMSTVGPQPDPVLGDWIDSSGGYNTSRVRELYGAISTTSNNTLPSTEDQDRGIFTLHNNAESTGWGNQSNYHGPMSGLYSDFNPMFPGDFGPGWADAGQFTIALWTDATYNTPMFTSRLITIHHSLINIFQDILVTTRNPALALQTLYTIVAQRAYYDALLRYNQGLRYHQVIELDPAITPNVTVGFMPSAIIPVGWSGYLTVMAVVGIHLVLLCIITTMFKRMTRLSRLGDFWATFGQTCGHTNEHARAILEEVEDVSGENVKKWEMLKERGQIETLSLRRGRGHGEETA